MVVKGYRKWCFFTRPRTPFGEVPVPTWLLLVGLLWIHVAPISFLVSPVAIACLIVGGAEWCAGW